MDEVIRDRLREIVARYGRELVSDPRRVKAILSDTLPDRRREMAVLVAAVEESIPRDLIDRTASMPADSLRWQLEQRLVDQRALSPDAASWAVATWAWALDVDIGLSAGAQPALPSSLPPPPSSLASAGPSLPPQAYSPPPASSPTPATTSGASPTSPTGSMPPDGPYAVYGQPPIAPLVPLTTTPRGPSIPVAFVAGAALVVVLVAVVVAYMLGSGSKPNTADATATPTTAVSASPSPGGSSTGTPVATATAVATSTDPATSTPAGSASVEVGAANLFAWKDQFSDSVSFLVIQAVTNTSPNWVQISGFDSVWTVYSGSGSVVATGHFVYVYPDYLAPGATGYLIDDETDDASTVADFATVQVNTRYGDAAGPDPRALTVSNTALKTNGTDVEATGIVTDIGSENVTDAHAAAIYFDSQGAVIGASWTNLIGAVDVGQTTAFETIGSNPLQRSDVSTFVVIASAGD